MVAGRERCPLREGSRAMRMASGRTPTSPIQLTAPRNDATNRVLRLQINFFRRADLFQAPLVHHAQPVGERQRLFLIVRDEQKRDAHAALNGFQFRPNLFAEVGIERREWFIQQQNIGLQNK